MDNIYQHQKTEDVILHGTGCGILNKSSPVEVWFIGGPVRGILIHDYAANHLPGVHTCGSCCYILLQGRVKRKHREERERRAFRQ